jgi:rhamnosyltransferase subunit B
MDANMRILIATAGSHGDVLPFIALGQEMLDRGHDVIFYANPFFEKYLRDSRIKFIPIGTIEEYLAVWSDTNGKKPFKAFRHVTRYFLNICLPYYKAMKQDVLVGETITIGHPLMFSTRFLKETHDVPTATIHLAPVPFRSNTYPSKLLPIWITPKMPKVVKNMAWSAMDHLYFDHNVNKPFNEMRHLIGLKPLRKVFRGWMTDADAVIGMFPQWFAVPQADWSTKVHFAGFPQNAHGSDEHLPEDVQAFLDAGDAPILFTAGTASAMAEDFFETSIKACVRGKFRGILLTPFNNQVPAHLPDGIVHYSFVPYHLLLPKLAAIVHHGGIGTTSLALHAGIPQLIRPVAYDQFDNANRVVNLLGVGKQLLPMSYTPTVVAYVLKKLVNDVKVLEHCRVYAKNLSHESDAIKNACDAILELGVIPV